MTMRKPGLSVLIPTYNHCCVSLVKQLVVLLQAADTDYEIIVTDDGSTDTDTIVENQAISQQPRCRFITREQNSGSAATRNFLATQSQYDHLLFIDCDVTIPNNDFIQRYLATEDFCVVNGGICITTDARWEGNLRYRYEKQAEMAHSVIRRQQNPYKEFRSTNFMIKYETFMDCRFDERFKRSGYEDVFFGKQLKQRDFPVTHIDNPVMINTFEDNPAFLRKTEQNLRTLHAFRNDLRGYSKLLTLADGIHLSVVRWLICRFHALFNKIERRILCSAQPSLTVFKLYRLGYFLSLGS